MTAPIGRRDFLKLAGLVPLSLASPQLLRLLSGFSSDQTAGQNVLVVVFDAFSGLNVSVNGYARDTTPNLRRLASRAIVYHNHYAGSNFTTPGTASLLTGTLPWTHRAFQAKHTVVEPYQLRNLFTVFRDYYRIGYSHNGWANILLEQAQQDMDELVPWKTLFLGSYDSFLHSLFVNDDDIASVSWTRNVNIKDEGYAYSLMFSHLHRVLQESRDPALKQRFPRGIPSTGDVSSQFLLETAVDWIGARLSRIRRPFAGYFHLLPPHGPYNTSREFYNQFREDGLRPVPKPEDIFSDEVSYQDLLRRRTDYDEFILYVDREFGRFYDSLEASGLLANTWVVLTSDHGEMFERGISAHSTEALYEPVVRIPLMIFEPGRTTPLEVHTPTSAADVLPTLAHVTGKPLPDWTEGVVMPPFAPADPARHVFVVRAAKNDARQPLTRASTSMIRDRYKLLYFFGYPEKNIDELVRLYDLQADPEEMTDLSVAYADIAGDMLRELKRQIQEKDQPYR
ncbi:MAG TPA: sulfatase-like hydrolase/transferase [Anaerolineales bacterium]|nr:sulfatase-like hydrolase/transferase [Anaerolineales bacterium]